MFGGTACALSCRSRAVDGSRLQVDAVKDRSKNYLRCSSPLYALWGYMGKEGPSCSRTQGTTITTPIVNTVLLALDRLLSCLLTLH
jgi:hypothetical protein